MIVFDPDTFEQQVRAKQLPREPIEEFERVVSEFLHELHGPKMDGPRNTTEMLLLHMAGALQNILNSP